jgi:hypothetical protein
MIEDKISARKDAQNTPLNIFSKEEKTNIVICWTSFLKLSWP